MASDARISQLRPAPLMGSLHNLSDLVSCHMPTLRLYSPKRNHVRRRQGKVICSRVAAERHIVAKDRSRGGQTDGKTISIQGGVQGKTVVLLTYSLSDMVRC